MEFQPLIFGVLYSSTVATLPKAIFMLAGALATASLVILFLIHAEPKSHYTSSSSNAQPSAPVTQRSKPTSFFTSFASLFSSQPSSSSSHRRSTNLNPRPRSSLVVPSSSNYGTISSHGKANGTGTSGKSKGKKKARFGVDNEDGEPERGRSRVVKRVGDAAGASGSSWDGYGSGSAYGEGVSVDIVPASVSVSEGSSWVDKSARV